MNRFWIFVCMSILGWAGWWLGEKAGFMAAFLISSLGSLLGVYVGWRINRDFFS